MYCYVCGSYNYGDINERFNIEVVFLNEEDAKKWCDTEQEIHKVTHGYYEAYMAEEGL